MLKLELDTDVVILDSIGELSGFFSWASVVFIGGSLVPRGGHNPLEAAHIGSAIVTGKYVWNFVNIMREMERQGAIVFVDDAPELEKAFRHLLTSSDARSVMGSNAKAFFCRGRGATDRHLMLVQKVLRVN